MTQAGVFTFGTMNLGDEMQSYAALAHLDRVHTFLDRDRLSGYQSDADTTCIFNSWFLIGDDHGRPAPRVKPIWHGFSGWKETIHGDWIPYLQEQASLHGSIGCRDLYTAEFLETMGIRTHWTGCLTLFLGHALPARDRERKGVLFIDVPPEAEQFIPADIVRRAERFSMFVPPDIVNRPLDRWAMVARIADLLSRAELVVTRRLHVALPAASYGTPVIAIPDPTISFADRRFTGFDLIVPTVYLDKIESGLKRIDWRNPEPARIPNPMKKGYAQFSGCLQTAGLTGHPPAPTTALDILGRSSQRLNNATGLVRPAQLRLRLHDRTFELPVVLWSDKVVEVALRGFPGLSKFEFVVEACPSGSDSWASWGPLRDLVTATPSLPS